MVEFQRTTIKQFAAHADGSGLSLDELKIGELIYYHFYEDMGCYEGGIRLDTEQFYLDRNEAEGYYQTKRDNYWDDDGEDLEEV